MNARHFATRATSLLASIAVTAGVMAAILASPAATRTTPTPRSPPSARSSRWRSTCLPRRSRTLEPAPKTEGVTCARFASTI